MAQVWGVVKGALLETSGWALLVVGLAAIPLPGPGVLISFAGLLLLARRHAWARRRVETVQLRALRGAAHSVSSAPRITGTFAAAVSLLLVGVAWVVSPPAPRWWPLPSAWWLPGGAVVGVSQLVSALLTLALLAYSYRRFRGAPEASAPNSGGTAGGLRSAAGPGPSRLPVLSASNERPEFMRGERHELPCQCGRASAA